MSTTLAAPEGMQPLAPGYTPRQAAIDAEMVALGRPALSVRQALNRGLLAAWQTEVEAWEHAHDSATEERNGPCKCGASSSCGYRWLELRSLAKAEDARLYAERFGPEAYAREQMRRTGFAEDLVMRSARELRDTASFMAARDWARDGTQWCLVLIGPPGCGKSQAGTWAAHQLLTRNNFTPRCVPCRRASEAPLYGMEAEEYRWRCRTAGLLLIDDMGEGKQMAPTKGAWAAWVDEVISERYSHKRKTIITTNRSTKELAAWLSAGIVDRLNEGSIVSTAEPSMRGGR